MITESNGKFIHRRQYIISPVKIKYSSLSNDLELTKDYNLYYHNDLNVTVVSRLERKIVLVGDLFDYLLPENSNKEIIQNLIDLDFKNILRRISEFTGRFVFIYIEKDLIKVVNDAITFRKVYYCKIQDKYWLSSRPNILASILKLNITRNKSKLTFYNSLRFNYLNNSNIGNMTIYDEILQLMPNHYLDLSYGDSIRFWPDKKIEFLHYKLIAEKCAQIIKGYMRSITQRYSVMLPVTAGKDSRLLLAATKDYNQKVFYYINRESHIPLSYKDIRVPSKLFKKLGIDFHVLDIDSKIDENFTKLYFENNPMASSKYLNIIYNYYENHIDKINLPGNTPTDGYNMFNFRPKKFTGKYLAELYNVHSYDFAINYYDQWLSECKDFPDVYNVDLVHLFYWEERLANWGSQTQLEKDFVQDEINLYNSRLLAELFFSVKLKYMRTPRSILHKEIMKILWPDVLTIPINPGMKQYFKSVLAYFGLYDSFYRIKSIIK